MDGKKAPQIPITTIVELKQTNSNSHERATGDWNTQLDNPIIINEGDEVSLKSAFVDSASATTGLIELKPDVEGGTTRACSITTGFYLTNIPSSLETEDKIATPADVANQRLVISKIYDPGLGLNGGTNNYDVDAGTSLSFARPDKGDAADGTVDGSVLDKNALNTRMTGEPYIAYHVQNHNRLDPGNVNKNVTAIYLSFQNISVLRNIMTQEYARFPKLSFDYIYWPAGPAGQVAGKQKHAQIVFNLKDVDQSLVTAFLDTFTGDPGGINNYMGRLHITPDLLSPDVLVNRFAPIISSNLGTTLSFPFLINNQNPIVHILTPGTVFGNVLPPSNYTPSNMLTTVTEGNQLLTSHSCYPVTRTTNFTLEAKKYTNDELATAITNAMTSVSALGGIGSNPNLLANSGIIATSRGLTLEKNENFILNNTNRANTALGADNYNDSNIDSPIIYGKLLRDTNGDPLSVDGDFIMDTFRLNDMNAKSMNYIVGSQNFSLEYNEDEAKYEITGMHTPLYDITSAGQGSSQIRQYTRAGIAEIAAVGNVPRFPGVAAEKFWANKYSGVYIAGLQPIELFTEQMKFGGDIITNTHGTRIVKDRNGIEMTVHGADIILTDGVNITGDFDGVGAVVQKISPHFADDNATPQIQNKIRPLNDTGLTDDRQGNYQIYDIALAGPGVSGGGATLDRSGNPPPFLSANENRQIPIFAKEHIDTGEYAEVDDPYYKIEVRSKIFNNMEGDPNYNRSISSIISKYYSSGNFTSSYNEGSISYIHKGAPVTIDNFNCRILNSEGELAQDVGNRNTIFLEITKILDQ